MGLGFIIIFFYLGVRGGIEIMFRLWILVIVFVILKEKWIINYWLIEIRKSYYYIYIVFILRGKYLIVLFILLY